MASAAALYLGAAAILWWHVWAHGLGSALPGGSVDPAQDVWWLAWVPHALGHGLDPFYSRGMFFPAGVNVLSNTSFLLVGVALSPVTVLFGPLAAFAVAVVLAPAASALVAFVAFRHLTSWAPAAFVGGLLYGFGPFVATDLRYGHLNFTMALGPPLLLLVAERLVRGRAPRPWAMGAGLAVVVVGEFFVSLEVLAVAVVVGALVVLVALVTRAGRRLVASCTPALAIGAGGSLAVLAFPVWWYLRGPQHFSGSVYPDMGRFSASLASFVTPHGELAGVGFLSGGNGAYLGVALLAILAVGAWVWRSDRRLLLAVALAALSAVLSLGPTLHVGRSDTGVALPAWPLAHLPLVSSVATSRFAVSTDLFCALALAIVLGHVHEAVGARRGRASAYAAPGVLGAVVIVPLALAMAWPYGAPSLAEPAVFARLAGLPAGAVVREYPPPNTGRAEGLAWQAEADFSYALTDGYAIVPGPGGRATVGPATGPLGEVFIGVYLGRQAPPFSPALVDGVRLNAWGQHATAIVVDARAPHAAMAAELLRAALGRPAVADRSGWLWLRT